MEIKLLDPEFSVCKVSDYSMVDLETEYCFTGNTDDEKSLVCPSYFVPENATDWDDKWKGFRIQGILDFSLIGVLSKISALLAENNIGIFVISTYNTDYIFVKKENIDKAINTLADNGYQIT